MLLRLWLAIGSWTKAEKWKQIQGLIMAINLPWVMVGDFNRTPDEVANSLVVRYLRGIVIAPNVPFTCASPSAPGAGRVIDMVIACGDLAHRPKVDPYCDHGFKPHVVGLAVSMEAIMDSDEAFVQEIGRAHV